MIKIAKQIFILLAVSGAIFYLWPANSASAANWASSIYVILTTGTSTWTVPGDWNSNSNSIEVIGGGGGGVNASVGFGGSGGGGGAYSSTTNLSLTPGASITVVVGAGGAVGDPASPGEFTMFNVNGSTEGCADADVCAAGGGAGIESPSNSTQSATSTGAAALRGVGGATYSGGDGGPGTGAGDSGGGGGGAAGPKGGGRYGGQGHVSAAAGGGGGGGGAGGGVSTFGNPGISTKGGDGGNGPAGTGQGTGGTGALGTAGSNGGGGGGSDNDITGATGGGGPGQDWATSTPFGAGGGGGGAGDAGDGGAGGIYGGGGGTGEGTGGAGGQGIIVIQYNPVFTISGTLYNDEGATVDTSGGDVIKLAFATGTTPGLYSTTTRSSGFFDFKIPYDGMSAATGSPMILWLDGQVSKAVAVNKASSTETMSMITNYDLYKDRVIVKHEGIDATSTTITDFARYDNDNDTDIPYIANGETLTVLAGHKLYVAPGSEFAPGGAVTISGNGPSGTAGVDGSLHLPVGAGQNANATSSILTMGSNALTLAGSLNASSTSILQNSNTITFNATTTGKVIIATTSPLTTLGAVTFNGLSGGWAFGDNASTTNFNITNGTVTAPPLLSISGNYTNGGTFTNNSGLVYFSGTSAQTLFGVMATSSPFNNVEFLGGGTKSFGASHASTTGFAINGGSGAVTAPSTVLSISGSYSATSTLTHNSGTILFDGTSGNQNIGAATGTNAFNNVQFFGAGTKTFTGTTLNDSGASTTAFTINSGSGAVTVPATFLSISGNYTNLGTFTAGNGTTTFSGTSAQTISGVATGTSAFYNLEIINSSASTTFSVAASTTKNFYVTTANAKVEFSAGATSSMTNLIVNGQAAGTPINLFSGTPGTQWNIYATGTRSVQFARIQDSDACSDAGDIDVTGGTNTNIGNNECWTFPLPPITVSGRLYSNEGVSAITDGRTIKLSLNRGATQSYTSDASGDFTFSVSGVKTGAPVAVWVSGDAATRGFALTKAKDDGVSSITGLDLYQNRLIVKHETTSGTSTTNVDLSGFPALDSAIQYSVSSGDLTVNAGEELHVWPGSEFAPGLAVDIAGNGPSGTAGVDGSLHLPVGSATSSIMTVGNSLNLAGSLNASSTSIFNPASGLITFYATTSGKVIIATTSPTKTLGDVTFSGTSGGWTFGDNASTTNFTISAGSVTAPSGLLSVSGNFSNSATFTHNSGTVYFTGTTKTLNSGGSSFNNIEVPGSYTTQTNSLTAAGNATVSGTLDGRDFPLIMSGSSKTLTGGGTLGAFNVTGTGSVTLSGADLTVGTTTINSSGTLTIGSGRVLTSTSSLAVSGTLSDSGGTTTIQHSNLAAPGGTLNSNVRFDASLASRDMPARTYGGNVEIFKSSLGSPSVIMLSGTHTISKNLMASSNAAGTLTLDGSTNSAAATISGDVSFLTANTSITTGASANTWQVSGNTNFTNGTFTAGAGNTWTMDGTSKTLTSASQEFKNLTLSGTITTADAVSVTKALVLSGSAVTLGATASTTDNATLSGTIYPQQQPVILNGISKTLTGGGTVGALETNGTYTLSGSDLTVGTSTIIGSGALTVGAGRVYTSTSTLTLVGSITGSGTTTIQHSNLTTGGTLSTNVSFDASGGAITAAARIYEANVEIVNGSGNAVTAGGNATSTSAFLINAGGAFTAPGATASLYIGGDYTNHGTFTHNSGKVFFNGSLNQIISGATSSSAFNNVDFSSASLGDKTFSGNASTTNFTVQSGAFEVIAPSLLSISGNYTNNGTFTHNSGTVFLNGASPQTLSGTLDGSTGSFNNLTLINSYDGNPDSDPAMIFSAAASTTNTFTAATASTTIRFLASATSTFQDFTITGGSPTSMVWLRSSSAGTPWGLAVPGTRSITYANVKDSSHDCGFTNIDATGGTNTDAGGNNCWTFVANVAATATSSADQTFEVNQSATAMSQLTVTAGAGTGAINAADATGDLRIAIATSTVNMLWDTTKTDAIFGGTASSSEKIAACGCVVFEGGGSVAKVDVTTNFTSGDVLTISGLRFTTFSAATASSTALQLFLNGPNDISANAQDTLRNVAIYGTLALGAHNSNQPANQFDQGNANLNNVEVFRFKYTPTGENASNTPTISLSNISGLVSSHITNANLYVDADNSASVNSGDYTVGGAGAVSITSTAGTIAFSTPFAATTTSKNYILRADFTSVNPGDQMTFGLTTANITASGTVSQLNITTSGSVAAATHFRPSGGGVAPTDAPPADVGRFGGTGQSGGEPTGGGEQGGQQGGGTGPGGGTGGGIDLEPLLLRKLAQVLGGLERLWKYFNR